MLGTSATFLDPDVGLADHTLARAANQNAAKLRDGEFQLMLAPDYDHVKLLTPFAARRTLIVVSAETFWAMPMGRLCSPEPLCNWLRERGISHAYAVLEAVYQAHLSGASRIDVVASLGSSLRAAGVRWATRDWQMRYLVGTLFAIFGRAMDRLSGQMVPMTDVTQPALSYLSLEALQALFNRHSVYALSTKDRSAVAAEAASQQRYTLTVLGEMDLRVTPRTVRVEVNATTATRRQPRADRQAPFHVGYGWG
ncbi:unnamed protein product [Vitrella brassicaformis CCMP3155]|uniref:Uncharacterized protein n=1 Tax=Vitrella brassicaformis (strain CCMP3155) TaxID=1169540 RepID=A0A0G4FKT7_VITBC|nr:unnamed protein product [Vitrella brassicaformis CCMP3155]|eukprot:CEM14570.1 unnamed protein product [Vitrella brassicaformis CCMP3155]